MALRPGTRLGPYEVRSLLGAGGMGEVYLARDPRLARDVAVKVLPSDRVIDEIAVARFTRETRAIAALDHPNICSVHDVGEFEGAPFLVMERLEGETLAARLLRGPLELDAWLDVGLALSDALEAAHAAGVIHRDLKPANIFLTRRGQPKILDFGLAKATVTADAATRSTDVLSAPGAAAGTVAYMSPEQLRGEDLDQRSDLFSLGLVLSEMATGRHAFAGTTGVVIATAILSAEPLAPGSVRAGLPRDLDRIVMKALEKDRDLRYPSAADLRTDIKRLRRDTARRLPARESSEQAASGDRPVPPVHSSVTARDSAGAESTAAVLGQRPASFLTRHRLASASLLALLVAVVAVVIWRGRPQQPSPGSTAFAHLQVQPLTFSGDVRFPAISPDGRFVAFVRQDALWVRQVSAASTDRDVLLAPRVEGRTYMQPTITPDGEQVDVVVIQGGARGLWRVPLLGGSPRPIVGSVLSDVGWSPDGKTMAFVDLRQRASVLVTADANGSNQRVLVTSDPGRGFIATRPAWSPDGAEILVVGSAYLPATGEPQVSELLFVDARSGAVVRRHPTGWREVRQAQWLDRSRLVIETGAGSVTTLWTADLQGDEWTPLTREFASLSDFDATADRTVAVATRRERRTGIWSVEKGRTAPQPVVTESGSGPAHPFLDTSGGLFYSALLNDGTLGIYRVPPNDTRSVLVTSGLLTPDSWAATRDGRVVVFTSRESTYPLRRLNVDGSGLTTLVARNGAAPAVTPDGRTVIFSPAGPGILSVPLEGGPVRKVSDRGICCPPIISPDGRRMIVPGVLTTPVICELPDCSRPTELHLKIAQAEQVALRWTPDGRGIAFVPASDPANIWEQPLDDAAPRRLTNFSERPIMDFSWSHDGARLVMSRGQYQSDMVLLTGLLRESGR